MSIEKKSLLDNRYQLLATSSIYTYDDENLTSYADFLRKFGRYIGKDGYVDTDESIHRANIKQRHIEKLRSNSESGSAKKPKELDFEFGSVNIAKKDAERHKTHEKQLKVIEDQMIQSKQVERAFKRQDGDVKKEQRQIRSTVREFDSLISKKKFEADKLLAKNMEEKKTLEVQNAHKKETTTKERIDKNSETLVHSKDKGRKTLILCNDLSRQFAIKKNELELKQIELNTLHNDFEARIRRKEEEESRVKKEIAEIALALNMETVKAKNDLIDFRTLVEKNKEKNIRSDLDDKTELKENISKTSHYVKSYDQTRRRLSAEAETEKSQWSLKQREANRRIVDTRNNLEKIYQRQRDLNEAAQIAETDKKAARIEKKIEDITNRKNIMKSRSLSEKIEKSEAHEELFKSKAAHKYSLMEAKSHEDHLKHFQRIVQKDEESEKELYKSVKEAEFLRRKKDTELKKMQDEFNEMKKTNAIMIKQAIAKAFKDEQEVQQKILREKGRLDKFHAEKEDSYQKLLSHREKVKEDKYLLEKHENEHQRLISLIEKNKPVE